MGRWEKKGERQGSIGNFFFVVSFRKQLLHTGNMVIKNNYKISSNLALHCVCTLMCLYKLWQRELQKLLNPHLHCTPTCSGKSLLCIRQNITWKLLTREISTTY